MTSFSFDPLAHIYDQTRGYPAEVAQQVARALDHVVQGNAQTEFLEVGVGTGRIAIPLASLGRSYTGVDISEKMLARLEEKLLTAGWQKQSGTNLLWGSLSDEDDARSVPVRRYTQVEPLASLRIVVADIEQVPFRDHAFDVVLAMHIFHLVSNWQQAVREALRVLRPGGMLLRCWDRHRPSKVRGINERWREIVRELGGDVERPGASSNTVITQWLQEQGYTSEEECVLTWQEQVYPRDILEALAQRSWSSSRLIPDEIFEQSIARLRRWANDEFAGDLETAQTQERALWVSKTRV